jgi:hypothetical protein
MEEPRDAAFFNGQDDGLVKVDSAFSALREEPVHDHLGKVFTKLATASRRELAGAFAGSSLALCMPPPSKFRTP